jgi:hypothetical protein
LKKKKVAHQSQSPEEEEEVNAQKNRCAKEGHRAKERPTSAEKLGPKNKNNTKIDK